MNKHDFALKNRQSMICHKTKVNQTKRVRAKGLDMYQV